MRLVSLAAIAAIALGSGAASAQAPAKPDFALPTESVTVIATKPSEETILKFVETRSTPSRVLHRMARWTLKVCPLTIGLGDIYAKYVTQRIRDVATAVGAPVNADPACRPNIEVVFTTTPQGLMDNVRKEEPLFLGYYDNLHQADELAKVTHSIQAWYTTQTLDEDGSRQFDTGRCNGGGTTINYQLSTGAGVYQLVLPCAMVVRSNGSRVRDGLSTGFYNILIVAEPGKLFDYEVGSLADYIAMMALSQPASLDTCQELPSISNLLANGCASIPARITNGDLAFLQGLYKMPDGEFLTTQRDHLEYEMKKTLVTDKQ